jgi:protein-L-isoaspartate(D-aspartate) O-methyltransferase
MSLASRRNSKFPLRLAQVQQGGARVGQDVLVANDSRSLLRPQRPLRFAHENAAHRVVPQGLGMDSADVRQHMVQRLRQGGVHHETVLRAFAAVPRHHFLDPALVTQAYEDTSLPIGHGQTISKPSVVARMIELLFEGANARASGHLGRVLEIGTGCGYQAALLSHLGRLVISLERIKPLFDRARETLSPTRTDALRLVFGDGTHGHPPNAPYDSIIAAAGGETLPTAWLDQLAIGGRLIVPVRHPGEDGQVLVVVDRTGRGLQQNRYEGVNFVPLKSGLVG